MIQRGLFAAASIWAVTGATPALATEHVYDLRTTPDGFWSQTADIGGGLVQHVDVWHLVDATTGASTGPGFTLSPGDVISGSVLLDHAWTPANLGGPSKWDTFVFLGGAFPGTAYPAGDQISVDYYLGSTLVGTSNTPIGGFGNRIWAGPDYTQPIPGATFDRFTFTINVEQISDNVGGWGSPSQVDGTLGEVALFSFAPVPEPTAAALLLAGLGALAFGARRRRPH